MNLKIRLFLVLMCLAAVAWTQSTEIVPPPGVVHEGIPPVPASLGKETSAYRSSPGSTLIGWDPEMQQVLIGGYCGNARCASRVAEPGRTPSMILKLPDWYRDVCYSPDGAYLVYTKPTDENFQDQIYRYDVETKAITLLTDGKSRNRYPVFSSSGKLLAYSSNRRNGRDLDVYVTDPLKPDSARMLAQLEGEDWAVFDWAPDDRYVILSDYKSKNETYLWRLDVETGRKEILTPATGSELTFNGSYAAFRKDGRGIYFITDRDSEFRRLAYLDFTKKRPEFLTSEIKGDIDEFALSPDGRRLAFIANREGLAELHLLDTSNHKRRPAPAMPAGVISGLIWHRRLPEVGFTVSTVKIPSDIFSIDVDTGKLKRWTSTATRINTDLLSDPELIKWKSFDGKTITGFLYRPPGSFPGKRPVIIDIHGGPMEQFRPRFRGEDNYFITGLGIACLYPNVRGSSGFGKTFLKSDDGALRAGSVRDIGALLDWIAKQPSLDPGRVMIKGSSYGGYLALSAAQAFPDRVAAVYSYIAPTNLSTFIERSFDNEPDAWRREMGDERDPAMKEFFERTAPVNNAGKITKPCFFVVGGKDLMTSVAETERIVSILRKNEIPVWYLLSTNESHGLIDIWTYNYAFNAQVLFVKTYLLPETVK